LLPGEIRIRTFSRLEWPAVKRSTMMLRLVVFFFCLPGVGLCASPCLPPAATQEAVQQFVKSGCWSTWPTDKGPRLSGAQGSDGATYTVHQTFRVYYSPDMAQWMKTNRPDGKTVLNDAIPDGSTMVAQIFQGTAGGAGAVTSGYLVMVRQSATPRRPTDPLTGWFWSQVVSGPGFAGTIVPNSAGEFGFGLCISCHSSAVNNLTFANYANIGTTPASPAYQPNFVAQNTSTLLSKLTAPKSNALRQPLDAVAAQRFIDFYNSAVSQFQKDPLPPAAKLPLNQVVSLASQHWDHVYLNTAGQNTFLTSDQCQGCHDTTAQLAVKTSSKASWVQPGMAFKYNPENPSGNPPPNVFNISQFGEWSTSIMALSGRDPVFLSQVETERVLHDQVDPTSIDNFCYRCHGSMGQRQFHVDNGGDPTQSPPQPRPPYSNQANFNHFMTYSTPVSVGTKFPYNQYGAQPKFAKYGALARDGVSCDMCHHVGPAPEQVWDGKNFESFYGYKNSTLPALLNPKGFDFPFSGNLLYNFNSLNAPPPDLNRGFVGAAQITSPAGQPQKASIWGHQQSFALDARVRPYLPDAQLCGGCHVVLAPKIPMQYPTVRNAQQLGSNGQILPPYYPGTQKPCPAPPQPDGTNYDPTQDPCVEISYEQTTYYEWAASASFGGANPQNSCNYCHMPDAQGNMMSIANINSAGSVNGQQPSNLGAFPPVAYRADSQVQTSQNAGYARHRLMAINLFVHEMFQQFAGTLGLAADPSQGSAADPNVPPNTVKNLLNAEETILTHAPTTISLAICTPGQANTVCANLPADSANATYEISVANNSGHRFPTGAGFRRGFLELRLLDSGGNTIWVSGSTNAYGAVLDGASGKVLPTEFPPKVLFNSNPSILQPHFATKSSPYISRQDQVQIYEVRTLDEYGYLTSATTRLFTGAKDNRIPPAGWIPAVDCAGKASPGTSGSQPNLSVNGLNSLQLSQITAPDDLAFTDPDFCQPGAPDPFGQLTGVSGVDHILYKIPVTDLKGRSVARVLVTMHYQAIPPSFLRDRYLDGQDYARKSTEGGVVGLGAATERMLYATSHLDTNIPNSIPGQQNLPAMVSTNWTMHIGSACLDLSGSGGCPPPGVPSVTDLPERQKLKDAFQKARRP
jgi:hypothetical protein